MRKLFLSFVFLCVLCGSAFSQNLTTVSGSNITDINGSKLVAGQLCFVITDQSDQPISVSIGGGGQALRRGYCSAVAAGVVASFTVPTPAATSPAGIYYRVTVKDSSTGQEVLRYTGVTFAGATFNFDNYAPVNLGSFAPLTGNSVSGNLSVTGNVAATGTVTGSNIPSSILQQIFNAGTGLTQRTAANFFAGLSCVDNSGTGRTDCRQGELNTVTFSATPTFDCSLGSVQKITLTANVTSSSLANCIAGQSVAFEVCQDGTGGRTFVQPAGLNQWLPIVATASTCSSQQYTFDSTTTAFPDLAVLPTIAGDATNVGNVITVAKVNGVTYPASPSTHSIPVTTAANTETYKVVPDCTDTTGNHVNYTQSTDAWSCGTSVPANVVTTTTLASPPAIGGTTPNTGKFTTLTVTGDSQSKRFKANQGSSLVVGDVGGLASWGTTATVTSVAGNDSIGTITITSSGTGQNINATFTLTFHDGTWTTPPLCLIARSDGSAPSGAFITNGTTATTASFFFNATPLAGSFYSATFICVGK